MHKIPKIGPIGNGWVNEIETKKGTRFVARWNAFVLQDGVRKKISCGPHELGPKISHGPGLRTIKQAEEAWGKVRWEVYKKNHPDSDSAANRTPTSDGSGATLSSAQTKVKDFITSVFEPLRKNGWKENSKLNWEYYRDTFLLPFFGEKTLTEMNDQTLIRSFMNEIADRNFSDHTAKKSYNYVKAILDNAHHMGIITGNAARIIPVTQRIPKHIKRSAGQPAITIAQFLAVLAQIKNARDRIILNILFLCAVRRGELFTFKWKDLFEDSGMWALRVERSFCSQTHRITERSDSQGKLGKWVYVPPQLLEAILGWKKHGDTDGDPESFIFPTRNGKCIIPTNWAEDVLKPAGAKVGLPHISYHMFRRGHATVQHHGKEIDKAIQSQMRHAKLSTTQDVYMQQVDAASYQAVVNLEQSLGAIA